MSWSLVFDGTITSPAGFLAGAAYAGIKTLGESPLDVGLLCSDVPCTVAGVFTRNRIKAAPLLLTAERVARGSAQALVVNSGIANACTGEQGQRDAEEMAAIAAARLDLPQEAVLVASTGVIGTHLPMDLLRSAISTIELSASADAGHALAQAIMTTDTFTKERALQLPVEGRQVTIAGIAKGAGMIHPDMATLLVFLTTDAAVERAFLQDALARAVARTFNMVTVDGDTSPNDMALLFANGRAGNRPLAHGHPDAPAFQEALDAVCHYLAVCVARDGEGATRLLTVEVSGARTEEDARRAARTIAGSMLVKAAVHGADPNWGRIIAALGRSGAEIVPEHIELLLEDLPLMRQGRPLPFDRERARQLMLGREVRFRLHLGLGDGFAEAWGCDLSEEYVTFNSAYTT